MLHPEAWWQAAGRGNANVYMYMYNTTTDYKITSWIHGVIKHYVHYTCVNVVCNLFFFCRAHLSADRGSLQVLNDDEVCSSCLQTTVRDTKLEG